MLVVHAPVGRERRLLSTVVTSTLDEEFRSLALIENGYTGQVSREYLYREIIGMLSLQ